MIRPFLEKWCPISVPQMAILFYIYMFVVAPFSSLMTSIFCVMFPPCWGIVFCYSIWYLYDRNTPKKGGRPFKWFRNHPVWYYMAEYFSARLIKTSELPPTQNYVFGCHPHGVFCFGTHLAFATESTYFSQRYPGLKPCIVTLPMQFKFPLRRELLIAAGMITSDPQSIEYVLKKPKGQAVCIIPGGAEEAYDSHPHSFDLVLLNRKGFVRLAIKNNAHLVPVFNFGENQTYLQLANNRGSMVRTVQGSLKKFFGFAIPILMGTGLFNKFVGMMPFSVPITTVVGSPIDMEFHPDPPQALVDKIHKRYMDALIKLFDEHKARYGLKEDVELRIV